MQWDQQIQYASISDIGFRRSNNQDSKLIQVCTDRAEWEERGHWFMVADGMGGHAVGELASKMAVDTVPHAFYKLKGLDPLDAMRVSFEAANTSIFERGMQNRDFQRMGTTCSALVLSPNGAIIGHVGDSRVYRIRNVRIDQLTCDHSLQWELLREGRLKPEEVYLYEPRHVITRSLGPEETVKADVEGPYPVLPGDTYLICSDGLTGHVSDAEIGMIAKELPPGEACRLLVNLANLRGGSDNVTVVIVRIGERTGDGGAGNASEPARFGWSWLAAIWLVMAAFVAGVCLLLFDRHVQGLALTVASCIGAAVVGGIWWRGRPAPAVPTDAEPDTVHWRPYRSAAAKFSRQFLNHLASLENELQQAAQAESWTIDWEKHGDAFARAKHAAAARDDDVALSCYAETLDVLMTGIKAQRRQIALDSRPKRPSSSQGRPSA